MDRTLSVAQLVADDHARLRRYLQAIVVTLLLAAISLLQLQNPMNRAVAFAALLGMAVALWLVRKNRLRVASYLIPTVVFVTLTVFASVGAGLRDPSIYGYFLVILIAGLALGKRGVNFFGALSVAGLIGIYSADKSGLIMTSQRNAYGLTDLVYFVVEITAAGLLLRVIIYNLNFSLKQARDAAEVIAGANVRLEQRVAERTAELAAAAAERTRLYEEQVKLVEELRAVDAMKSQFLASMSHELRTPLNAILNFTEFMMLGMMGPVNDKQIDALQKTLTSGKHLLALINDVLDMTKIQSGMMKLFVEENIDLRAEVEAVCSAAASLLHDKAVEFITEIDPHLPALTGDRRRIRQILLNLLSNACKFTEEGSVRLCAQGQGDEVLFCVQDTGPGIAPEDHTIIFEPFRQTEAGIQHAGGTGLGLPISRKLAEVHGGRLWVESQPGQGASFFVALPVASPELKKLITLPEEKLHVQPV